MSDRSEKAANQGQNHAKSANSAMDFDEITDLIKEQLKRKNDLTNVPSEKLFDAAIEVEERATR